LNTFSVQINDVDRTSDKGNGNFDPEWGQEFTFISPPPEISIAVKVPQKLTLQQS
jgi:hypothetical protein